MLYLFIFLYCASFLTGISFQMHPFLGKQKWNTEEGKRENSGIYHWVDTLNIDLVTTRQMCFCIGLWLHKIKEQNMHPCLSIAGLFLYSTSIIICYYSCSPHSFYSLCFHILMFLADHVKHTEYFFFYFLKILFFNVYIS